MKLKRIFIFGVTCSGKTTLANKNKWIIEGTHREDWIVPSFKKSNFVIIPDLPRYMLFKRIITRTIKNKITKNNDEEARRIATRNGLDFGNRIDMKGELMGAKYFEEELDTEGRDVYRHPKEN